ncbi:MAG: tRNA uridine-5-carboxymethylaminomethyl(34) synthesis GTPase MnmE [Clostridia bacterium]|nr:tRNA uridine-5-carboxymethylaminomethyl(34) synthesis GTPase MnmE [Clostridia bacterium]
MNSTIVAISTALAPAGIGVIRLSGPQAIEIADKVFLAVSEKPLSSLQGYESSLGYIIKNGQKIDKVIATVFKDGNSYTGEDVVEFSCHGSVVLLKEIVSLLINSGATLAQRGEFSKRAYVNGRLSLEKAEALMTLINASSVSVAHAAFQTLNGNVAKEIDENNKILTHLSASIGAYVDYPDEDLPDLADEEIIKTISEVSSALKKIKKNYDSGKIIQDGIHAVIIGKPNVGKSTLMNLLSGYERSIITDIPGTTRDIVEDRIMVGDIPLIIADTAGIRDSSDPVESIGIQATVKKIESSELIISIFDGSDKLNEEDLKILELCKGKTVLTIINKTDLGMKIDIEKLKDFNPILISAKEKTGLDSFEKALSKLLKTNDFDPSAAFLVNERQRENLTKAIEYLDEAISAFNFGLSIDAIHLSVDMAIDSLLELKGEKATKAVVDEIFNEFCVGK